MANEVTTGLGRTGKWFGFQYYDFKPDIVSVGKVLGNGYPISGVAISSMVAESFQKKPFRYAQSHQNDALGCSVGSAVLTIMERDDLISQSFEKGGFFRQELVRLQTKHASEIIDIRARGLMIAIELFRADFAELIYNQLIDRGFLVGLKEKTMRFMPPLVIEKVQINALTTAIDEIINGIQRGT